VGGKSDEELMEKVQRLKKKKLKEKQLRDDTARER
jgi:hypothetical protein